MTPSKDEPAAAAANTERIARLKRKYPAAAIDNGMRLDPDHFLEEVQWRDRIDQHYTRAWLEFTYGGLFRRRNLDERTGLLVLRHALEAPTRQIAENSSADGGVVVEKTRAAKDSIGFDAAHGTYVDLTAAGIIDPVKVLRIALENAVSVASVLLLTEATLTEIPEPAAKPEPLGPIE